MHTCPWWFTRTFDNPLRRLFHDPRAMLRPHVREGMRAADIGCGMGYFTVALAELVGAAGHVQAVDMQPQQLRVVARRCRRAGVADRVGLVEAAPDSLRLSGPLDFVLAFWMVHEIDDQEGLFRQLSAACRPGARVIVAEPRLHVARETAAAELARAEKHGFTGAMKDRTIRLSWTFELERV
jgi:ubiquinone/menaquinone biosynthesis C-methylase UbiE